MKNSKPIGVFDSGLGGLTLVREIKRVLPNEDVIYLGDTARVPYGTRSKETVTRFSLEDAKFLEKKGVKCIVIACNTASSISYNVVKKRVRVPVLDVVTSVSQNKNLKDFRKIGVIGTNATIKSGAYEKVIKKINPGSRIYLQPCPLFVPLIESGETGGKILDLVITKYLKGLRNEKLDSLILGCTHYPIIKQRLSKFFGKNVKLINPAVDTVNRLKEFLAENGLENSLSNVGKIEYFITDVVSQFEKVAEVFLGEKLDNSVKKVTLG